MTASPCRTHGDGQHGRAARRQCGEDRRAARRRPSRASRPSRRWLPSHLVDVCFLLAAWCVSLAHLPWIPLPLHDIPISRQAKCLIKCDYRLFSVLLRRQFRVCRSCCPGCVDDVVCVWLCVCACCLVVLGVLGTSDENE